MVSSNNGRLTLDEIRHGVAGVLSVLKGWAISDRQVLDMLGAQSLDELRRWVSGEARSYPGDLPHRIGLIGSIHSRLRQIHQDQRQIMIWLSTPSLSFENKRPLDVMAGGHLIGLMMVRDHLKSQEQAREQVKLRAREQAKQQPRTPAKEPAKESVAPRPVEWPQAESASPHQVLTQTFPEAVA